MSFIEVQAGGRLTSDPEMKQVGDTWKTSFSIAHNKRWKDKEKTIYLDVEVWGPQAENVAEHKRKGDFVAVIGDLDMDEWEERDSGKKRRKLFLHARYVDFGGKRETRDDEDDRPRRRSRDTDTRSRNDDRRDRDRDRERYNDLPF